jgi:hypothetical protein
MLQTFLFVTGEKLAYIDNICWQKHLQYREAILPSLLAFATLGAAKQIRTFQFVVRHPRWPRQVQSCVTITDVITLNFANGKTA